MCAICFLSVENYRGKEGVKMNRWRSTPQTGVVGTIVQVGSSHLNIAPICLIESMFIYTRSTQKTEQAVVASLNKSHVPSASKNTFSSTTKEV